MRNDHLRPARGPQDDRRPPARRPGGDGSGRHPRPPRARGARGTGRAAPRRRDRRHRRHHLRQLPVRGAELRAGDPDLPGPPGPLLRVAAARPLRTTRIWTGAWWRCSTPRTPACTATTFPSRPSRASTSARPPSSREERCGSSPTRAPLRTRGSPPGGSRSARASGPTPAVVDREELQPGYTLNGPAIVEEPNSTTFVPPGYRMEVDGTYCLIIEAVKGLGENLDTGADT
ncbi:hypothetical protein [Streptosporangium vulgare]|uniref:hypothetical protein n=1 Tax=Streptosporangium vulgare TaxID=46190 RepID=UPI003CD07B6D